MELNLKEICPQNIFLTGATGVIGSFIMKDLLEKSCCNIQALVRGPDGPTAVRRLAQALKVYDPAFSLQDQFVRRVNVVCGDIAQSTFGLSYTEWRELAERTDIVIHAGASTNLFAPYAALRPANVDGTKHAVDFCLNTAKRAFCHLSSYTILGDQAFNPGVHFTENDFDLGQRFPRMGYQQSKYEAETVVRGAGAAGLEWVIVRVGNTFGESRSGLYPRQSNHASLLLYDTWKTALETKTAPQAGHQYDIVPVDYVSRAVITLAVLGERFKTFHLVNPSRRTYSDVASLLALAGYKIEIVPFAVYKDMVLGNRLTCRGQPYKSLTTKAFKYWALSGQWFDLTVGAHIDSRCTHDVLQKWGISCPAIDSELCGTYLEEGIRNNYFPPPG